MFIYHPPDQFRVRQRIQRSSGQEGRPAGMFCNGGPVGNMQRDSKQRRAASVGEGEARPAGGDAERYRHHCGGHVRQPGEQETFPSFDG